MAAVIPASETNAAAIAAGAESPGSPIADAGHEPVLASLSTGYRRYALWMLLIIYTLNFLDRQIVNIIAEDIKNDLGLADWQIGMMSGLAFAIFYTVLGIPIARLAERANRPAIIAASVGAWSFFTVVCGFAQNFWQLVLARIGVGVGEAGCSPPAHSLISDYVPKAKRASAIAFYSIGTPLGTLLGLAMGGLIADAYGWRVAFFVAGAPGVIVALLTLFTLPEPRSKLKADMAARAAAAPSLGTAFKLLTTKRTFWFIAFGAAIKAFIGYGHAPFTASFFLRVHGEELKALAAGASELLGVTIGPLGFLGLALSAVGGTAGVIGAWLGGYLGDKLGSKDLRAYMSVPAIAAIVAIPIYVVGVMADSATTAIVLLAITSLIGTLWYGPVYATGQSIVPPQMRATCAALLLFIINLIGLGLGPLAVGIVSDVFASNLFEGNTAEGIRWALIVSMGANVIAFGLFWAARGTIREETVS